MDKKRERKKERKNERIQINKIKYSRKMEVIAKDSSLDEREK